MDAAIVSDYGYGVLTPRLIAQVAALQQRQRKCADRRFQGPRRLSSNRDNRLQTELS